MNRPRADRCRRMQVAPASLEAVAIGEPRSVAGANGPLDRQRRDRFPGETPPPGATDSLALLGRQMRSAGSAPHEHVDRPRRPAGRARDQKQTDLNGRCQSRWVPLWTSASSPTKIPLLYGVSRRRERHEMNDSSVHHQAATDNRVAGDSHVLANVDRREAVPGSQLQCRQDDLRLRCGVGPACARPNMSASFGVDVHAIHEWPSANSTSQRTHPFDPQRVVIASRLRSGASRMREGRRCGRALAANSRATFRPRRSAAAQRPYQTGS